MRPKDQKFFLWVHYIDPHSPYTPHTPFDQKFVKNPHYGRFEKVPEEKIKPSVRLANETDPDHYIAQYDGEILFLDREIQRLFDHLEKTGLAKNSLIVLTVDHGESLGEHDLYFDHGKYTYDACARVPLLIRYDREIRSPQAVREVVSLADIFPTLLDFLKMRPPHAVQGHSLRSGLISGKWDRPDHVLIESDKQMAVRTTDWKLVKNKEEGRPPLELYDLLTDPQETTNLIGKDLPQEALLKQHLDLRLQTINASGAGQNALSTQDLDADTLEQLKSLGYIGG